MSRLAPFSIASFFIAATLGSTAALAAQPAATPWLKNKVEQAKEVAQRKVKPGTEAADKAKKDSEDLVNKMLAWDVMTPRALGSQWDKRTEAEQTEFATLFRKMIETSYRTKMDAALKPKVQSKKPKKVDIEWQEEVAKGDNKARVTAMVKSKKTKALLEFDLIYRDGDWRVYDLAIDDARTLRTYRSMFLKLIKKDGFPAVLDRMRSKIKDIEEGRGDLANLNTANPSKKAGAKKAETKSPKKSGKTKTKG